MHEYQGELPASIAGCDKGIIHGAMWLIGVIASFNPDNPLARIYSGCRSGFSLTCTAKAVPTRGYLANGLFGFKATRSGHGLFGGATIGTSLSAIGAFAVLLILVVLGAGHAAGVQAADQGGKPAIALFGYKELKREGFAIFPQWTGVMQRRARDDQADRECNPGVANCPLRPWKKFLAGLVGKPALEQLAAINAYGNRMKYIQDIDNYGVADYWAAPKEFIFNSGDCEDYVIFKYFSLRELGFGAESMRIVTVQDTNLRIAHAVLAIYINNDILILDNQTESVISHHKILHYAPIYSVNESYWWMHMN